MKPLQGASSSGTNMSAGAQAAPKTPIQTAKGPLVVTNRMLHQLAPLPDTASRLLVLLNDPDVALHEVADVASRDVGITAAFLRMANSPVFGLRGRVGTVTNAVRVIGMVHARLLVLASGISQIAQREMALYGLGGGAFMRHSELVANLSMVIAHDRKYANIGLAYTGGLLHDIGKVILNSYAQKQGGIERVDLHMQANTCTLLETEQTLFGTTHAEIGRQLAELWALPPDIVTAIALHHSADPATEEAFLAVGVRLANQLACTFDPTYPLFLHPAEVELPAWLSMEAMYAVAREYGYAKTATS